LSRGLRKVDVDGLPFAEVLAAADAATSSSNSSPSRREEDSVTATATAEASPGMVLTVSAKACIPSAARHPYDAFMKSLANQDQTKALQYFVDLECENCPPCCVFFLSSSSSSLACALSALKSRTFLYVSFHFVFTLIVPDFQTWFRKDTK
jgi:hypothetical protein